MNNHKIFIKKIPTIGKKVHIIGHVDKFHKDLSR